MAFSAIQNDQQKSTLLKRFEDLTIEPEYFIRPSTTKAEVFTKLTRQLYSKIRSDNEKPNDIFYNKNGLKRISTAEMDEEGLWNQIDSENKFFVKKFVQMFCEDQNVEDLVKDGQDIFKQKSQLDYDSDDEEEQNSIDDQNEDNSDSEVDTEKEDDQNSTDDDDGDNNQDSLDLSDDEFQEEAKLLSRKYKLDGNASEESDDDALFKQSELDEARLKKEYDRLQNSDGDHSENEDNDMQQSDNYEEDNETEDGMQMHVGDEDDGEINEEEDEEEEDPTKSAFERMDEKMRKQISKLEEQNMKEKPWQLKGETDANSRPQNSLLEEYVDFESGQRPAPLITEEISKRLEKIIVERIKDQKFDDVERKVKQAEQAFEYKRRIVLDSEKSKLSLAQLYEGEFLKLRDGEHQEKENPSHTEIRTRMRHLFLQLDSLCNFHYTPKLATSEIKIVNNLPAITAEEAIPAAISDACLVAPQEIVRPQKNEVKGDSEKTKTDRARERRIKKLRIKEKIRYNKQQGRTVNLHPNRKTTMGKKEEKSNSKDKKLNANSKNRMPKEKEHEGIRQVFMKSKKN